MTTTTAPTRPNSGTPTASPATTEQRLRLALRTDAIATAATGFALALAPDTIDEVLGTGHPGAVRLAGLAFVAYAVDVALVANLRRRNLARWAPVVAVVNELYVVSTVIAIALGAFSTAGAVAAAAVGAFVATMATLQWRFARTLATASDT